MAFYLFQGRYSQDAMQAMIRNPSDRKQAAAELVGAVGGTLHQFFFTFGERDFMALIEGADDATMAACAMAVGASGAVEAGTTTKLIPMEEALEAMRKAGTAASAYRPPAA